MLPVVDIPKKPGKPVPLHKGKKLAPDEYIKKTRRISSRIEGFKTFDDFQELDGKISAQTILDYRIHSIKLWTEKSALSTVVLGIQVFYQNIHNWSIVYTSLKYGEKAPAVEAEEIVFSDGELILDAEIHTGTGINSLKFITSRKQILAPENKEGVQRIEGGNAVIGFYGSIGESLQSLGFYTASLNEVRYWRKRPYILMKAWLSRKNELQEEMVKFGQNEKFWAGAAFVMLVGKGDQIFAQVMRFV